MAPPTEASKNPRAKFLIAGSGALLLAAACFFVRWRGGPGEPATAPTGPDATRSTALHDTPVPAPADSSPRSSVTNVDRELEKMLFETPGGLLGLLESQDPQKRAETLNQCGILIRAEITASGDYQKILRAMDGLPKSAAKSLLSLWIIRSKSPAGAMADFTGQREIVRAAGLEKDLSVYQKFLTVTGGLAAAGLIPDRGNTGLSAIEVSEVLNGSVKELGVATCFPLVKMMAEDNQKAETGAVDRAVQSMLAEDPMKTSSLIGDMPKGPGRDAMVRAMVSWLRRKGDTDAAAKWQTELPP